MIHFISIMYLFTIWAVITTAYNGQFLDCIIFALCAGYWQTQGQRALVKNTKDRINKDFER